MSRVARPYQAKCISEVIGLLSAGANPLLQAGTGSGKTFMAGEVIRWWLQHMPGDVWFTVHRGELMRQASASLKEQGIRHGFIAAGKPLTDQRVQVVMQPTAVARSTSLAAEKRRVGLVIPDECHHSTSDTWIAFLQGLKAQRLGLSATPWRLDGKPLGTHFNAVVKAPPVADLVADGYLADAWTFAPPVPREIRDSSKVTRRAGDLARNELAAVTNTDPFNALMLCYYERYAAGEPGIMPCVDIAHSQAVAARLQASGWRAVAVYGEMDKERPGARDDAFAGLADDRVQLLTYCELINEGVDVPRATVVVDGRETQSTGLYLQNRGRVLRPVYAPGFSLDTREERLLALAAGAKPRAIIVDLVGNVRVHGMHDEPREWSLSGGIKGMERAVRKTIRCRKCYLVETDTGQAACSFCGAAHPKKRESFTEPRKSYDHLTVQGATAAQVLALPLKDKLKLARTEDDLKKIGLICGYKPGWAYYQWQQRQAYRERFQPRRRWA